MPCNLFTPEERETINKHWVNGQVPAQCTGNCKIDDGFLFSMCDTCCWTDAGLDEYPTYTSIGGKGIQEVNTNY